METFDTDISEELTEFLRPAMQRDVLDQQIIDVLVEHTGDDGFVTLSQTEIARRVNAQPPLISTHVRRLVQHGYIGIKTRCTYRVLRKDVINHGTTRAVLSYLQAYAHNPAILSLPIKQQMEEVHLTELEIHTVIDYIADFGCPF